jgi:hypothetical protein
MKPTTNLPRRALTLSNKETLRILSAPDLTHIVGGRASDTRGLSSLLIPDSCNTCNLGF